MGYGMRRRLLLGVAALAFATGCTAAASGSPIAVPTGSPSPAAPSASSSPSALSSSGPLSTATSAALPSSDFTVAFLGDGFSVVMPEPLQSGYVPGEGVERWEATRDSGQRIGVSVQTLRQPPASQRSLDGLTAALKEQLGTAKGVTITSEEKVELAGATAVRVAAEGGGEWTVFYLLYEAGKGFVLEMLNLTDAEEAAITGTFSLT